MTVLPLPPSILRPLRPLLSRLHLPLGFRRPLLDPPTLARYLHRHHSLATAAVDYLPQLVACPLDCWCFLNLPRCCYLYIEFQVNKDV